MKNHFFQLDILRALAVSLVILYHFNIYTSIFPFWNVLVLNGGHLGVNIFFVISGMLISKPFVVNSLYDKKMPDFKRYAINRLLRILPLFWFISTILFLFKNHIALYYNNPSEITVMDYIKFYLFDYSTLMRLNPPIWTLRFEMIFYLLFPFLFSLTLKWHILVYKNIYLFFLFMCAFFLIYRFCFVYFLKEIPEYGFFNNLEPFLLGVMLSFFTFNKSGKIYFKFKYSILISSLSIIGLVELNEMVLKKNICYYPVFQSLLNIGIFLLFVGLLQKQITFKNNLVTRAISGLSLISYSVYLLHFNIYYNLTLPFLKTISLSSNHLLAAFAAIIITLTLSMITYFGLEKQFLNLKTRL